MNSKLLAFILCGFAAFNSLGQQETKPDSVKKKSLTKRAFQEGLGVITTTPKDTIVNEKSTDPFAEYKGRIIREIYIERIGFEKSIYDSAKKVKKAATKLANFLHVNTRQKVIRNHLFIEENQPLNPYRLADNERYLRDRDFILDSRIVVTPIEGTDSVDLLVITRDVFSIGGTGGGSPTSPRFSVYDANVAGGGQRIEFSGIIDPDRAPIFGHSLLYRKSSIFGSLANFEVGYTQLNKGRSYGESYEYSNFIRLNRPLVSPYTRLAGGLELSRNWSENVFNDPDSIFLDYKYNIFDSWIGYNIGIHKTISNRNRHFLALRYFNGQYQDQPEQQEYLEERIYNNVIGYLGELTFFRQDFYKTRYVFGFGRTEDIPYGISLGVTGGYMEQLGVKRPYSGLKLNYGQASKKGNFYRFLLQSGGYYNANNERMEDVVLQAGAAYFTKLWSMNRYKIRNYISTTYTSVSNRRANDWILVGKKEIPGFKADTLDARSRFNAHLESFVFTPGSILGFRFAPFAAIDFVWVDCYRCLTDQTMFMGYSAGIRTRNENLIFGTMEFKATYIPSDAEGSSKFSFSFKQNLRIKNTGYFVTAPSLIRYN